MKSFEQYLTCPTAALTGRRQLLRLLLALGRACSSTVVRAGSLHHWHTGRGGRVIISVNLQRKPGFRKLRQKGGVGRCVAYNPNPKPKTLN